MFRFTLCLCLFFISCSVHRQDEKLFYLKKGEPRKSQYVYDARLHRSYQSQDNVVLPEVPASSADTLFFTNPSFTGVAGCCAVPKGWQNFGSEQESPPDIQPGAFGVSTTAQDGDTYVGLSFRDNQTNEAIGQKMAYPLQPNERYAFSVWLASGRDLQSQSRISSELVFFDAPVALLVLGYDSASKKGEVLAHTESIGHMPWLEYKLLLTPKQVCDYVILKSVSPNGSIGNGYLLVDKCSPMIRKRD